MADGDQGERLARLEGVFSQTMPRMEEYMRQGIKARIDGNRILGSLQESVVGFKEYQEECDKQRKDHETRINATEDFQRTQIKVAGAAGGIMAFLVAGGAKVLDKIFS